MNRGADSYSEAWAITPRQLFDFLETLPEDHFFCAEMAVGALQDALKSHDALKTAPWKKAYRKFR